MVEEKTLPHVLGKLETLLQRNKHNSPFFVGKQVKMYELYDNPSFAINFIFDVA